MTLAWLIDEMARKGWTISAILKAELCVEIGERLHDPSGEKEVYKVKTAYILTKD